MVDFAAFFAAAHAHDGAPGPQPYPWQARLAHRLATAAPPAAIVAPTGGGKTGTIDALVWALAMQAERATVLRTVGVRTVWAIDRRILVDEVHAHASSLAARLSAAAGAAPPGDPLGDVARALLTLTGDGSPPLLATRWRGGIPIGAPAHHPLQPEIITSTVAQVGSRLLFRGYGVGRRSLAVQAALTAVDTTVCLDEAHLAEPFRQTVQAIVDIRSEEALALPPLHLITLTATPSTELPVSQVAAINDADRAALGPRLTGTKVARLVEPATTKRADRREALLAAIEAHLADGAGTVACVVNSVRTAVDVHRTLERRCPSADRMVLVGPQRPADRAEALRRHHDVLFARTPPTRPLVLVATQTFEVGLDADVEALVTESASAAALVQRLGRLNRAGIRHGAATIVRDTDSPLYEPDEGAAWAWLTSLATADGTIDVSVDALARAPGRPAPTVGPRAPALTVDVLERLVQTEPRPAPMDDPDIDVFLRGAEAEPSADVLVAWRADLRPDDQTADGRAYREALLTLAPPQPAELVTVSIACAHALLGALRADSADRFKAGAVLDAPDLEGVDAPLTSGLPDAVEDAFTPILLRGDEHIEARVGRWEPPRPGDVVVLPAQAGGYREAVLDFAARAPVTDVGADAVVLNAQQDGVAASSVFRSAQATPLAPPRFWRLSEETLRTLGEPVRRRVLRAASRATEAADPVDARDRAREVGVLIAHAMGVDPDALGFGEEAACDLRRVTHLADPFAGDIADAFDTDDLDDLGFGLEDEDDEADEDGDVVDAAGGDASAMFAGERRAPSQVFVLTVGSRIDASGLRPRALPPPTLDEHARDVAARVADYAHRAALGPEHVATLTLAARAHDHGKAEPRTQAFFRGGSTGPGDATIAKSVFGTEDRRADRAARRASGLPSDLRHEVESVGVLMSALASGGVDDPGADVDQDLLLHVVGTHHGLGLPVPRMPHGGGAPRPYLAQAAGVSGSGDGDGQAAWADGAWLERFLALNDRYGPWALAYLRTLLVLADRTVSSEQRVPDGVAGGAGRSGS